MKISVNKVIRYIIAAILFAIFSIIFFYTSAGNNKFTEPADLILSVFTPTILIISITYVLYKDDKKIKERLLFSLISMFIFLGGLYLSRNYWYKLDTFWSFTLSVILPGVLIVALYLSPIYKNINSEKLL